MVASSDAEVASVCDWFGTKIKKVLRSAAFSNGIVDNNILFKSGYGYYVSLLCQICFLTTFIYQAAVNTQDNRSRKYLSPVDQVNTGAICTVEPVAVTGTFTMDQRGYWDTNKLFNYSEGIYDLELKNVKFPNGQDDYLSQIQSFEDNFKIMSDKSFYRDYAWNMVFAASYSDTSFDNGGVSQFRTNADARIMYKPEGDYGSASSGITNVHGVCDIVGVEYLYDEALGSFQMTPTTLTYSDNFDYLEGRCGGNMDAMTDLDKDVLADAASISTALAVNMGITSLSSLSKIFVDGGNFGGTYGDDFHDYYNFFDVYVDRYYSPMQPIYCFKVDYWLSRANGTDQSEWDSSKDNLCLVKLGNTFAMPLTNQYGTNDYETHQAVPCTPDTAASEYGYLCDDKSIMISLLFFLTYHNYEDYDEKFTFLIDLVLSARKLDPEQPDLALMMLTFPIMRVSSDALFQRYNNYSIELKEAFMDFCDGKCTLLNYYSDSDFGDIFLNGGDYPYNGLAFNDPFYKDSALSKLKQSPVQLTEKYQECQDSFSTAFTSAISNAFASAGLYTSILLVTILTIIMQCHNLMYPSDKLASPDKVEATVRNSIVRLFEILTANGKLDAVETQEVQELLQKIVLESSASTKMLKRVPLTDPTDMKDVEADPIGIELHAVYQDAATNADTVV